MKLLSAEHIRVGGLYLTRRSYNSKSIAWEVCEILDIFPEKYNVRFLEDGTIMLRPRMEKRLMKQKGHYSLIEDSSIAAIDQAWYNREALEVRRMEAVVKAKTKVLQEIDLRILNEGRL